MKKLLKLVEIVKSYYLNTKLLNNNHRHGQSHCIIAILVFILIIIYYNRYNRHFIRLVVEAKTIPCCCPFVCTNKGLINVSRILETVFTIDDSDSAECTPLRTLSNEVKR